MTNGIEKLDWGVKVEKPVSRFKGQQDVTYRIAILSAPFRDRTHYVTSEGYIRCLGGRGKCPLCDAGHYASERFGMVVAIFTTDSDGNVTTPAKYKVQPWIVGITAIQSLQGIYKQFGDFSNYDIIATCTNERSQAWTINPARDTVRVTQPEVGQKIMELYQTTAPKLSSVMAKDVTLDKAAQIAIDNPPEQRGARGARGGSRQQAQAPQRAAGAGYMANAVSGQQTPQQAPRQQQPMYPAGGVTQSQPQSQPQAAPAQPKTQQDFSATIASDLGQTPYKAPTGAEAFTNGTISAPAEPAVKSAPATAPKSDVPQSNKSDIDDLLGSIMG